MMYLINLCEYEVAVYFAPHFNDVFAINNVHEY